MMVTDVPINYLAVLVSAIVYMIIGGIWYSPKVFGQVWLDAIGRRHEEFGGMGRAYIGTFIGALLSSFVLALIIKHLHLPTWYHGACVGFWAWLGFAVPGSLGGILWENKPWKVFFIHAGCMLITFLAIGALLGAWK